MWSKGEDVKGFVDQIVGLVSIAAVWFLTEYFYDYIHNGWVAFVLAVVAWFAFCVLMMLFVDDEVRRRRARTGPEN